MADRTVYRQEIIRILQTGNVQAAIDWLARNLTDAALAGCHHCGEEDVHGAPCHHCGLRSRPRTKALAERMVRHG